MYIYNLAGNDEELASAELKGFLRSLGLDENPEVRNGFALTEAEPSQLKRLALVHEIGEVKEISDSLETGYRPEGSYAVRAENVEKEIETELGNRIKTDKNNVDLENPEELIKIYKLGDEYCIARIVQNIDRGLFQNRKNQERPFSSPVSLDPVLARVMVNLSEVSAGGEVLDPFCGTGGILIEAGLCGIKPSGLDLQEKMVEGTRENLEEYGIRNHDIKQGEVAELNEHFERNFDAIVTDLPYGQSSTKKGDTAQEFLDKASSLTDGKVIFMSNQARIDELEPEHELYVHKNLTRYIYTI